jgi:hypothetical protein
MRGRLSPVTEFGSITRGAKSHGKLGVLRCWYLENLAYCSGGWVAGGSVHEPGGRVLIKHSARNAFGKSLVTRAAVAISLVPLVFFIASGGVDAQSEPREEARILYSDVLKDPDNIPLNFRFARQQVTDGNVKGASATLERILLIQPDLAAVRLFYAAVLIRLDSLAEAEQQLDLVTATDDPRTNEQVDRYRDAIADRRKRTHVTFSIAAGGQYDTNPSASPAGNSLLVSDIAVDTDTSDDDYARVGQSRISFTHDLGYQAGHALFGGATFAATDQVTEQSLDLTAAVLNFGVTYHLQDLDISPELLVTDVNLADQQYFLSLGGRVKAEYRLAPDWRLTGLIEGAFQDYDSISVSTSANENSGSQFDAEIGVKYFLAPDMRLRASVRHTDKRSEKSYNQYYGDKLSGRFVWLLGEGRFLSSGFSVGIKVYDGADSFVSARTRRDEAFKGRVTLGLPVNSMLPATVEHALFENFLVLFSGEYYSARSNITNYTYDNSRAQVLLSKSWRF